MSLSMQSLNSTIFRIIAISLVVEIVNLLLFFTQFECVCILMSTLTHSGIVMVKRSPPTPKSPKVPVHQCALICFYPQWKRNVYKWMASYESVHCMLFCCCCCCCCFFLRWLKTHVQLIVITSQNLHNWLCMNLLFSAWRAEDKQQSVP